MRKLIKAAVLCLLPLHSAYSTAEVYKISNLNLDYFFPSGEGTVDYVDTPQLKLEDEGQPHEVLVDRVEGKYVFQFTNPAMVWEDAPELNANYDQFVIRNFNWVQDQEKLGVSLEYLYSQTLDLFKDVFMKVEGLDLKCNMDLSMPNLQAEENLYQACTSNGTVKISLIEQVEKNVEENSKPSFAKAVFEGLRKKKKKKKSDNSYWYKNIDAKIVNNKATIYLTVEDFGGTRITIKGRTDYVQEDQVIKIKVDSAKAGFFSVKKRLFESLKASQSDSLRVDEPYIYINSSKKSQGPGIDF